MHTPQSTTAVQPAKPQHPEKARCQTAQLQPPCIKWALHDKLSPPGRWRDLRLCSPQSTGLQMLSVPTTQPCNVTSSSASWLFSPKVSQPTAQVCIYRTKRGIKRKGLSSAPQTWKDQVASAAIYSLRFIKLSFVPNFQLHQTKATTHNTALFLNSGKCTGLSYVLLSPPFVSFNMQDVVRAT